MKGEGHGRVVRLVAIARGRLQQRVLERRYGLPPDSVEPVRLRDLGTGTPERVDYEPSPWRVLARILRKGEVSRDDVFVDFGSGKGRVVLEAATYPFGRVIGVELNRELTEAARQNIARCRSKLRCKRIELVTSDALDFDVPDDVTVVYFHNPFTGATFSAVLDKLVASVRRTPRRLRVIYLNPVEHDMIVRSGRFREIRSGRGAILPWRPAEYIRLYEVLPAGS